jgi:hypothetical protein
MDVRTGGRSLRHNRRNPRQDLGLIQRPNPA